MGIFQRRITFAALVTLVLAVSLMTFRATSAQATSRVSADDAVPGVAPATASAKEPEASVYLDEEGKRVNMDAGEATSPARAPAVAAAVDCTPISVPDNPHYSSGDVSGHGYWEKGTCTKTTAKVKNALYEYYTDDTWRLKANSPTKTVYAGGGSGNRTVARAKCDDRTSVSWRNHVDVNVQGQSDTGDVPYRQAQVKCRVH
jgi:hypothetical protein